MNFKKIYSTIETFMSELLRIINVDLGTSQRNDIDARFIKVGTEVTRQATVEAFDEHTKQEPKIILIMPTYRQSALSFVEFTTVGRQ